MIHLRVAEACFFSGSDIPVEMPPCKIGQFRIPNRVKIPLATADVKARSHPVRPRRFGRDGPEGETAHDVATGEEHEDHGRQRDHHQVTAHVGPLDAILVQQAGHGKSHRLHSLLYIHQGKEKFIPAQGKTEDRRRRQSEGIEKARTEGKYRGRQINSKLHRNIEALLRDRKSYSEIVDILGCSRSTIAAVKKRAVQQGQL